MMKVLLLLTMAITIANCTTRYPTWPGDFKWSSHGKLSGYICTQIREQINKGVNSGGILNHDYWSDNYFCYKDQSDFNDVGMVWSRHGKFLFCGISFVLDDVSSSAGCIKIM